MIKSKNKKKGTPQLNHDESANRNTLWLLLGGIFLTSFSLIAFEITLSRLLSVLLSYHYVFVVLSLSLLGLGVGGIFVHFLQPKMENEDKRFSFLTLLACLFSLTLSFSLVLMTQVGYSNNILVYGFFLFFPFFFAGAVFAEVYRMFPGRSARIYGVDLVGAASGSLGVIYFLDVLGGIRTTLLLGAVASVSAPLFAVEGATKNRRWLITSIGTFLILFALFGVNLIGLYSPGIPIGTNPTKEIHDVLFDASSKGKIIETRWSAFGRTDLVAFGNHADHMDLYIDGTAGSPMYRFNGDLATPDSTINSLKNTFPGYFPFLYLREEEKDNALIIGPGGGRDVLLALMGGIRKITAVEINKDLVELVRKFSAYNGGVYNNFDNVRIVVGEGRNFLKREKEKFDMIMLSLPVTTTSRSLEGYALTENFLFTTDSIGDYLDHLTDEGQLVIVGHNDAEILRLLSISLVALDIRGVPNTAAMTQIYILGSDLYPVFVLKKRAFEREEILLRYKSIEQFDLELTSSYLPYLGRREGLNPALVALSKGEIHLKNLEKMVQEKGYDISPVTDNNPFFYKIEKGIPHSISLVLWASIILLSVMVLVPSILWKNGVIQAKNRERFHQTKIKSVVLFSMLGFGFILIEICLIQRFALFLGHPALSMALLLFGLLGSAGMGSMLSGRLTSDKINLMISIASLSVVIMVLGYIFFLPLIFNHLLGLSFALRLLFTVFILIPLGFLMGFPFPLGLRGLKEISLETYIPWMWGINGTGSVLGSVVAIVVAIGFGFTQVLLVSALCYFIVFLIFLRFNNSAR